MDDSFLSDAEHEFLAALQRRHVRFLVVGATAAVLQGADTATQDIDLWFEDVSNPAIAEAAREAGGFFSSRTKPPMLGGEALDAIDVVAHMHGLRAFDDEYPRALEYRVGDLKLRVLPLERVILSKEATGRPKDSAALPALRAALAARASRDDDER